MLLGAFVASAAGAFLSACSLDWSVRPEPGETSVSESGADAAADGPRIDAPPDSATEDAPVSPDGSPCGALATDVVNARKKARECQLGTAGQCTTTVDDECGCKVIVRTAGSSESNAYASAVAALVGACGKPAACSTTACPQLGVMAGWACLVVSSETRCTP